MNSIHAKWALKWHLGEQNFPVSARQRVTFPAWAFKWVTDNELPLVELNKLTDGQKAVDVEMGSICFIHLGKEAL